MCEGHSLGVLLTSCQLPLTHQFSVRVFRTRCLLLPCAICIHRLFCTDFCFGHVRHHPLTFMSNGVLTLAIWLVPCTPAVGCLCSNLPGACPTTSSTTAAEAVTLTAPGAGEAQAVRSAAAAAAVLPAAAALEG
jgi:hypothetical protein